MFTGASDVRIKPDGSRILLTPITWRKEKDNSAGLELTANAGMIFDGASIPIFFSFLNGPSVQLAAALHDAAYRAHAWDDGSTMTRMEADWIIYAAARVSQAKARLSFGPAKRAGLTISHFLQRTIIWLGVVVFGALAWRSSGGRDPSEWSDAETLDEIETILSALELTAKVVPNHDDRGAEDQLGGSDC